MPILIKCGERRLIQFDPHSLRLHQPIIERCKPSGRIPDNTGHIVVCGHGNGDFEMSHFCDACTLRGSQVKITRT